MLWENSQFRKHITQVSLGKTQLKLLYKLRKPCLFFSLSVCLSVPFLFLSWSFICFLFSISYLRTFCGLAERNVISVWRALVVWFFTIAFLTGLVSDVLISFIWSFMENFYLLLILLQIPYLELVLIWNKSKVAQTFEWLYNMWSICNFICSFILILRCTSKHLPPACYSCYPLPLCVLSLFQEFVRKKLYTGHIN